MMKNICGGASSSSEEEEVQLRNRLLLSVFSLCSCAGALEVIIYSSFVRRRRCWEQYLFISENSRRGAPCMQM